jgi:hypothetical protein
LKLGLKNKVKNSENFNLSNFDFICSNRENRKGGGVGFFISNSLNYKLT